MNHVLFLCSGNYYRSRFAEIVFNWHAESRHISLRAESRGLAIDSRNPGPISPHTMESLSKRGITSRSCERLPLAVREQDFAAAWHIVAVKESEHRALIETCFPRWKHRVEYWQIHDLDCAEPRIAIPHLERQVVELLNRLNNSNHGSLISMLIDAEPVPDLNYSRD